MKTQIANIITGCRIVCSILLLFFHVFSLEFYMTYLFCGFSDMIDGTIARKTNSNSDFGAKFDTVADFIFMIVVCYKLLLAIFIPQWLWIWIIVIAVIKFSNIFFGFVKTKSLISIHSILNKITGLVLFLFPLMIQFIEQKYIFITICLIATISAIHEVYYIITGHKSFKM